MRLTFLLTLFMCVEKDPWHNATHNQYDESPTDSAGDIWKEYKPELFHQCDLNGDAQPFMPAGIIPHIWNGDGDSHRSYFASLENLVGTHNNTIAVFISQLDSMRVPSVLAPTLGGADSSAGSSAIACKASKLEAACRLDRLEAEIT